MTLRRKPRGCDGPRAGARVRDRRVQTHRSSHEEQHGLVKQQHGDTLRQKKSTMGKALAYKCRTLLKKSRCSVRLRMDIGLKRDAEGAVHIQRQRKAGAFTI